MADGQVLPLYEYTCERCGDQVQGGSHYHCGRCDSKDVTGMMGHCVKRDGWGEHRFVCEERGGKVVVEGTKELPAVTLERLTREQA